MQIVKKIKYETERVGDKTFCTITGDLTYLMKLLEGINSSVILSDNSVIVKMSISREQRAFIKCLKRFGVSVNNPKITIVTSIKLYKEDEDNQDLANKIARDKAYKILCKEVSYALDKASLPLYNKLFALNDIRAELYSRAENNDLCS